MKKITHCIFDLDGLLLDTEKIFDEVFAAYAKHMGKSEYEIKVKLPPIRAQMHGLVKEDAAHLFLTEMGIDASAEDWFTWRSPELEKLFPNARPMPGAKRLVEHLQSHSVPIAIATSSPREHWLQKSHPHSWLRSISIVITGSEVVNGKPSPEIFLTAAKKLNAQPNECLVFEDAINGFQSAKAANTHIIIVPVPDAAREDFADADEILDSLADFKPAKWGLPAYDS